jgi:hypothetical protein
MVYLRTPYQLRGLCCIEWLWVMNLEKSRKGITVACFKAHCSICLENMNKTEEASGRSFEPGTSRIRIESGNLCTVMFKTIRVEKRFMEICFKTVKTLSRQLQRCQMYYYPSKWKEGHLKKMLRTYSPIDRSLSLVKAAGAWSWRLIFIYVVLSSAALYVFVMWCLGAGVILPFPF